MNGDVIAEWIKNLYDPQEHTKDGLDAVMIKQFLFNLNYLDPLTQYIEQLYEDENNRIVYVVGKQKYVCKDEPTHQWTISTDDAPVTKFVRSVAYALHESCQKVIQTLNDNDACVYRACKTVQHICKEIIRDDKHDFYLIALIRTERILEALYNKHFTTNQEILLVHSS